jgi:hypothetical protein
MRQWEMESALPPEAFMVRQVIEFIGVSVVRF